MKTVVVINSELMGRGDDKLGEQILGNFFNQLLGSGRKPDALIFYNAGVKLLLNDSPVSGTLDSLFKAGVDLIACGTCVSYFKLNEKMATGRVSNMQEIVSILTDADKVVTI